MNLSEILAVFIFIAALVLSQLLADYLRNRRAKAYFFTKVEIEKDPDITYYRGTPAGYERFFESRKGTELECIVGSSIIGPDGHIYTAMKRGRHGNCNFLMYMFVERKMKLESINEKKWNSQTSQGFLTNYGRHVSREEAYDIAIDRGQILTKTGNVDGTELFSEDVWDTVPPYMSKLAKLKQSFIEDPCGHPPATLIEVKEMLNVIEDEYQKAEINLSNWKEKYGIVESMHPVEVQRPGSDWVTEQPLKTADQIALDELIESTEIRAKKDSEESLTKAQKSVNNYFQSVEDGDCFDPSIENPDVRRMEHQKLIEDVCANVAQRTKTSIEEATVSVNKWLEEISISRFVSLEDAIAAYSAWSPTVFQMRPVMVDPEVWRMLPASEARLAMRASAERQFDMSSPPNSNGVTALEGTETYGPESNKKGLSN